MAKSEVKVLRLKVGDFIIAKVSELKDKYTMQKPMALGFVVVTVIRLSFGEIPDPRKVPDKSSK